MRYKIEKSHDLEAGALLKVGFPENQVDKKALYTIQRDMPDFLLPFTCRSVDGMMECSYRVGNFMKLEYRFGTRKPEDYVRCWNRILQPLIDCRDWFLNPYSFVLEASELYTDREERCVKYVYIPSSTAASDYETLKAMVMDISRQNVVDDPVMENTVLKALMQDFSPKGFLRVLSSYRLPEVKEDQEPERPVQNFVENLGKEIKSVQDKIVREDKPQPQPQAPGGEIRIDFSKDGTKEKGSDKKKAEKTKAERTKPKKEKKSGGFLGLGKKKQTESSRILGAPAEAEHPAWQMQQPEYAGYGTFQAEESYEDDPVTQIDTMLRGTPCLVYVGNKPDMPLRIEVAMSEYGRFTIGRFDFEVGTKQSDFEFDKNTKGVSRHHAVIEGQDGSYSITDLQSSAGTYVNGARLEPGKPRVLEKDCRVSFGYDGADYMWNG